MLILIKIVVLIFLLILLIKFRVNLALAIIIDAVFAGIVFQLNIIKLISVFPRTLIQTTTLEFLLIIYLVILLGNLMRETGYLVNMVESLERLFIDYRFGIGIPSALIGLLPMPAGAMFSAPIVKEVGHKTDLPPEKMTYVNFWFRHLWEYFWPLYPGIILSSAIFSVSIRKIIITMFPLSLCALAVGIIFILGLPQLDNDKKKSNPVYLLSLLVNMWPIILIILLVLVLRLRMLLALAISVACLILVSKVKFRNLFYTLQKSFSLPTLGVIYAVFLFKNVLNISGALGTLPQVSSGAIATQLLLLFFAPFIVGFLTGVNAAFVGITFPILAPIISPGSVNLSYLMFAYASGFCGVLLSPVHLCLSLTKEYYRAELPSVYKYLIPSVVVIFIATILLFLFYNSILKLS